MTELLVKFEYEKETKNSVRYKEIAEPGRAPVLGTVYVQKWFAEGTKNIEVTIKKKD
ncbi:MAG: hypothetical protein ACRBHB_22935 [Arenicella sp.]